MKLLIGSSAAADHGAGVHSYVNELCNYLVSCGHRVTVASRPPICSKWSPHEAVRYVSHEFSGDPLAVARQLSAMLAREEFDGIINNDHPILQSLAPVSPCPFIAVGHLGRLSIGALACHNHASIDYVVAISSDMKRSFARRGVPAGKIPVVFNGVADAHATRPSVANGALRLIYAGGYLRYKGADLLASAALSGDWTGVQLHWYGTVPERVGKRLSRLPHVALHGRVSRDVFMKALAGSDCVVLPSREEGCPMVMLEAMCLGVAPVVSDGIGAMKEIVRHQANGLVCSLRDWNTELHAAIRALAAQPHQLARLKEGARHTYVENHTIARTAETLLALLRRPTVDRSRRPAQVRILDWHRPPSGTPAWHVLPRIRMRLGLLRYAGLIAE